jgi:signal recognition particle subunit SRP54
VLSLVERAQMAFDDEESERINKKIRQNQFTFEEFYSQLQQIKKMGPLKDLMGMVPGMSQAVKDVDVPDDAFKNIEAIIQSMTVKERQKPEILDMSRKKRIADGSGTTVTELNNLLKQFDGMKKMMKMMNNVQDGKMKMPNMKNMMKR